ncbi:hypothetical protein G7046_g3128 [Stylonectria norvegica]|nr:hypothetical protein G7046_g3128 [Stylonectria norvegica]
MSFAPLNSTLPVFHASNPSMAMVDDADTTIYTDDSTKDKKKLAFIIVIPIMAPVSLPRDEPDVDPPAPHPSNHISKSVIPWIPVVIIVVIILIPASVWAFRFITTYRKRRAEREETRYQQRVSAYASNVEMQKRRLANERAVQALIAGQRQDRYPDYETPVAAHVAVPPPAVGSSRRYPHFPNPRADIPMQDLATHNRDSFDLTSHAPIREERRAHRHPNRLSRMVPVNVTPSEADIAEQRVPQDDTQVQAEERSVGAPAHNKYAAKLKASIGNASASRGGGSKSQSSRGGHSRGAGSSRR